MDRITYIYPLNSSFIEKDIQLLSEKFIVYSFSFNPKYKLFAFFLIIKQIFQLPHFISRSKVVFIMFAGYHSLIPVLLCKFFNIPVFIILGGMECHSFPLIDYGNFRKWILGKITCVSLNMADCLVPVHKSLMISDYTYYDAEYKTQGCMFFCNNYKLNYIEIYNGYDHTIFNINTSITRAKGTFITVLSTLDYSNFERKGIDLVFDIAKQFPNNDFTLIGVDKYNKDLIIPRNIRILPRISNINELVTALNKHEFYLQLSIAEGFPNALCEAMLCGCIPIGSEVFGIPDIINNCGYILRKKNRAELKSIIENLLSLDSKQLLKKSIMCHEHIKKQFPIDKRKKALLDLASN